MKIRIKMNNKLACLITTLCFSISLPLYADSEDYSNQDVSGMKFSGKSMRSSNWRNANLSKSTFTSVDLYNANFNDAIITNSSFISCANLTSLQLYSTKSYKDKNLQGIEFRSLIEFGSSGLDLSSQNLTNCVFGFSMVGVDITDATIVGASLSLGLTSKQLYSTKSYREKNLFGVILRGEIRNFSFKGQNLTSADLSLCDVRDSDFTDTIINDVNFGSFGTTGFTKSSLISTKSYKEKNLRGVKFSGGSRLDVDLSGQDLSNAVFSIAIDTCDMTDSIIEGADFSYSGMTKAQIYSTKSYKNRNLSGVDFSYLDLRGISFENINLQNTKFESSVSSHYYEINFYYADLRGATLSSSSTHKTQNTIWTDGEIKNFSMTSAEDNFSIRKYVPATTGGVMINAKIVEDATISGGAVLTLEEGAVLEISAGKTLTVSDNGEIVFDVDAAADDTNIILNSGSKLVFGDNSKLTINLTGEVSETDPMHFTVIKAADDSYVLGLDTLPKDNIILNVNSVAYDSSKWGINFDPTTGTLDISVNIPEPATYATIFTVLALGFVAYRRRK